MPLAESLFDLRATAKLKSLPLKVRKMLDVAVLHV